MGSQRGFLKSNVRLLLSSLVASKLTSSRSQLANCSGRAGGLHRHRRLTTTTAATTPTLTPTPPLVIRNRDDAPEAVFRLTGPRSRPARRDAGEDLDVLTPKRGGGGGDHAEKKARLLGGDEGAEAELEEGGRSDIISSLDTDDAVVGSPRLSFESLSCPSFPFFLMNYIYGLERELEENYWQNIVWRIPEKYDASRI